MMLAGKLPQHFSDATFYEVQADDANRRQRKSADAPQSASQTYTLASVATRCSPSDCWIVIRDKVYDVTSWVPKHPGGALIYINAGKDCTQLFDSYHPLYVRYVRYSIQRIR